MSNNAMELPLTPYAGTSGWSGSETSQARAKQQDSDGTTKNRQSITLKLLEAHGVHGITWKELSNDTGWHHGSASGVLSVLHKSDKIARLKKTRDKCAVYVANNYIYGRLTDSYKSNGEMFDVSDLMRQVLKTFPEAVISEAEDGEIIVHTRMRVISSDEQIAPIGDVNVKK